jgi:hypothetical protein
MTMAFFDRFHQIQIKYFKWSKWISSGTYSIAVSINYTFVKVKSIKNHIFCVPKETADRPDIDKKTLVDRPIQTNNNPSVTFNLEGRCEDIVDPVLFAVVSGKEENVHEQMTPSLPDEMMLNSLYGNGKRPQIRVSANGWEFHLKKHSPSCLTHSQLHRSISCSTWKGFWWHVV